VAYMGNWGCFIYIPKTGGVWVKHVLKMTSPPGKPSGGTHGLPKRWNANPTWAIVRDPGDWLASAWAWRIKYDWQPYSNDCPWKDFCALTDQFRTEDWDEWFWNIQKYRPGIVSWFFHVYTPPPVETYTLGKDAYKFLRSLGYNPDDVPPANVGEGVPELTIAQRNDIRKTEKYSYERWRF
jgi:hypothetical protein